MCAFVFFVCMGSLESGGGSCLGTLYNDASMVLQENNRKPSIYCLHIAYAADFLLLDSWVIPNMLPGWLGTLEGGWEDAELQVARSDAAGVSSVPCQGRPFQHFQREGYQHQLFASTIHSFDECLLLEGTLCDVFVWSAFQRTGAYFVWFSDEHTKDL